MRQLRTVSYSCKVQTYQSPSWTDNKKHFIYTVETCSRQHQRCNNGVCLRTWQEGIEVILRQILVLAFLPSVLWRVVFLSWNWRPCAASWSLEPSGKGLLNQCWGVLTPLPATKLIEMGACKNKPPLLASPSSPPLMTPPQADPVPVALVLVLLFTLLFGWRGRAVCYILVT